MPKKHSTATKRRYLTLRRNGFTQQQAMAETGIKSTQTARKFDMMGGVGFTSTKQLDREDRVPDPIAYADLKPEAKAAFDSFPFFAERYLCREPVPWRQEAADQLVIALANKDTKDFFGINCPPGSGKTSLALDVALWCLIRDRGLRVLLGAEVLNVAAAYLRFVKDRLSSLAPFRDREGNTAAGVIPLDFGRLQPSAAAGDVSMWTADSIIIAQLGGDAVWSKEPNVQVASRESGFLGNRFDFEIWDDLLSIRNYRDAALASWWRREAETRLDPGGVLALLGTRIGPEDLFEECFGRTFEDENGILHQKYHQIVFPAHNDGACDGDHDGRCLLDPKRVPWSDLVAAQDDQHYGTTYNQDPSQDRAGLVQKVWLVGGIDENNEQFEGGLDQDRSLGEMPNVPGLVVYVTVDPSLTTGNWGIEVWGTTKTKDSPRWLIDGVRGPLRWDDFIHVDASNGLGGVMSDLQRLYAPSSWIVESNIGRVLDQTSAFGQFNTAYCKAGRTSIIWARTWRNKSQGQASIEALIPPLVRSGRMRLPWRDEPARTFVRQLMAELVSYPRVKTSDLVIASWLAEAHIGSVLSRATRDAIGGMEGYVKNMLRHHGRPPQTRSIASDPEYHTKRNHHLVSCVACPHLHYCVECSGYAMCPTICSCVGQEQMVAPGPTMPGDNTMVVYGNVVRRDQQTTEQLSIDEQRRVRAQQIDIRLQNPVARAALGLPNRR